MAKIEENERFRKLYSWSIDLFFGLLLGLHVSMRSWNRVFSLNPQQLICDSETLNLFEIAFQHLPVESRHCSCWGGDFVRHHPTQTSTLQTFPRESMSGNQLVFCRGIDAICCCWWWWMQHKQVKARFFGNFFRGPKPMKLLAKVNTVQTIFSE